MKPPQSEADRQRIHGPLRAAEPEPLLPEGDCLFLTGLAACALLAGLLTWLLI